MADQLDPTPDGLEPIREEHERLLRKRGVPFGVVPDGLYSFSDLTLTPGQRATLRKHNLSIPAGATGLMIEHPPCLDGVRRLRLRLDTPIDHPTKPGRKVRYIAQSRVQVAPYITPEARTAIHDGQPVVIVEAALKAISLSTNGIPAIGLGGVDAGGLNLNADNITLHPELAQFDWTGRTVTILYDAGIRIKYEVARAAAKLALAFRGAGAACKIAKLPLYNGQDDGPDDHLAREGVESIRKVLTESYESDPYVLAEGYDDLTNLTTDLYFRAALDVAGPVMIDRIAKLKKMSKKAIKALAGEQRQAKSKEEASSLVTTFVRGDHAELASHLVGYYSSGTTKPVYTEGQLYSYDAERGIWAVVEETAVSRLIQSLAGTPIGVGEHASELRVTAALVAGTMKCLHDLAANESFFERAATGCAFANGFARVTRDGVQLGQHSPDHRARHCYAHDYEAGQVPERFVNFLRGRFSDDIDAEEKVAAIQEFIGNSRLGIAPKYERSMVLYGPLANDGKSTLLAIIRKTFPDGSVSALSPWAMGERFRLAEIVGKLLNMSDDDRSSSLDTAGIYKEVITAKNPMTAERKGRDTFLFIPRCGLIYACNTLPRADDQSNGWYRRQLVIAFNNTIEAKDVIRSFEDTILEHEHTQIACWSLDGAARCAQQNGYTIPASHEEIVDEWHQHSDSSYQFVAVACEETEDPASTLDALYVAYVVFAQGNGNKAMAKSTFGNRIKKWRRHTDKGNRYRLRIRDVVDSDVSAEELAALIGDAQAPVVTTTTSATATAVTTTTTVAMRPSLIDDDDDSDDFARRAARRAVYGVDEWEH